MKRISSFLKKICAAMLIFSMVAGLVPAAAGNGSGMSVAYAQELGGEYELNNGYIRVMVSPETGGFGIRTLEGDKVNKSDNDRYLVFEYDEDHTSFTSFQVTRGGETKEYIFGGTYPGSSQVSVSKRDGELIASWSVDDLTFVQTISLVNTGAPEHGAALISYSVRNAGAPAEVKCRILMDTALGYWDYGYYHVNNQVVEFETALGEDGYNKSFYVANNTSNPSILAYTINASVDSEECKPYQTIFGHWNNLASTVFDYTPDTTMNFTNAYNIQYKTSDSAYALYFDMEQVDTNEEAVIATNYGVYSNESVLAKETMTVNINAPNALEYAVVDGTEDRSSYENGGLFDVKTYIRNISEGDYSKVRIMVYATGGVDPLDQDGNRTNSTYESPYFMEINGVKAGQMLEIDWDFFAQPKEVGQYAKIHYKIYDVSDEATAGTGAIMNDNLLGDGCCYILCPGSIEMVPSIQFTGSSPETIYSAGLRNLFVTGENFSILAAELEAKEFELKLSRADGNKIHGQESVVIPSEQVQIDDATNVMTVIFSEDAPGTLQDGMYQLTIDYQDTTKADMTGQALRFHVSSEVKYKNDSYGFLAVVKDPDTLTYTIERFEDAEEYWFEVDRGTLDRTYVLLELQGSFVKEKSEEGQPIVYTGTSLSDTDNVMTLNDCLDIRNGTMKVMEDQGSIKVDFDADIYTTGSGTSVWSGEAALTELEAGQDYCLIPYSENGERNPSIKEYPGVKEYSGEPIALLWPSVGQGFQSLMGLLFEFKYGELGTILHNDAPNQLGEETRVVGFGAAMDLSFLIPGSVDKQIILDRAGTTKSILGTNWDAADHNSIKFSPEEIRALNKRANYRSDTVATNATTSDVAAGTFSDMTIDATGGYNAAYMVIDDVLFGGEYLGVNMAVCLGIPPYISGMPAVEGLLEIHTVGDWAFGVDGQCHFLSFSLEAGISFKSKDDIPIPNNLHFFLGGITPGINVDGVGVLWLQGAGGGIENLYDTIFLTDAIPPLKLIIEAQFSIMQLFSARASLGLSLRGIDISLTNGRFSEVTNETTGVVTRPQPITMDAGIRLDWYPEFYFHGVVNLMLARVITGGGYVVADHTGFYEFFIRAGIQIPNDVPFIGGISLADVNMGVNDAKVWGQAEWLKQVIGITYYWGGDIDWNNGSKVYPTYPELVGMKPEGAMMTMALDRNEETNQTLYMSFGTNLRMRAMALGFGNSRNLSGEPDELKTDAVTGALHTMKVGNNGNGKLLVIQWSADSEAQAKADAAGIRIVAKDNYSISYPIHPLNDTIAANADANAGANANLSYNTETKTAYYSVSLVDSKAFDYTWSVHTPLGSQLVLYDVEPLPKVEIAQVQVESNAVAGDQLAVTLDGQQLEKFTKLSFFVEGKASGESYFLGSAFDPFATTERKVTLSLPQQMVSDTYTLRVIASDGDGTYYSEANKEFEYINLLQPTVPEILSVENAGDYKVLVKMKGFGDGVDGYQFTARDAKGNVVAGMEQILLYLDGSAVTYQDNGTIAEAPSQEVADGYLIGGHYEYTNTDESTQEETTTVTGLGEGEYTIEVRHWKKMANGAALVSAPASMKVVVRRPVKTEIQTSLLAEAADTIGQITMTRGDGSSYVLDAVNGSKVTIQLRSASESFTGKWMLDGGVLEGFCGEITTAVNSANVSVQGLNDGVHLLSFVGKNQYGDAVSANYQFVVDTLAPRLQLAEPVNGGLFDYWTGKVMVSGLSDADGVLTIVDNTTRQTLLAEIKVEDLMQENGMFAQQITLDRAVLSHDLTITVKDALGNEATKDVTVSSNGLGSIEEILIYAKSSQEAKAVAGSEDVTNTKLPAGVTYELALMAKLKRPEDAAADAEDLYVQINKAGMVDWVQDVAEGEMEMTEVADGVVVNTHLETEGMITAYFQVNDEGIYGVSTAVGKIKNRYTVILPTQTVGYSVQTQQSTSVEHGESFRFTVMINNGFVAGKNYKVLANGEEIQPVDGVYIIDSVEYDIEVTVVGVERKVSHPETPSQPPEPAPSEPTGDNGNLWLWAAMACVSAMGIVSLGWAERRRKIVK